MSGERHLEARREDPDVRGRLRRRQDERRLGQVHLPRERLHLRVGEAARVLEHAQGISREPVATDGEHVDDAERVRSRSTAATDAAPNAR